MFQFSKAFEDTINTFATEHGMSPEQFLTECVISYIEFRMYGPLGAPKTGEMMIQEIQDFFGVFPSENPIKK